MATIITKNSQTASAVPSAAQLSVGELAVNTADGKLYTEHTGGIVKEIIPSTVSDGGITTAKIADSAVTNAKIANSAVTVAKISATGTPSSTTFLRGDGSWQTAGGGESNNRQVFTSSGTFNVPAGVSRVKVTVIGAGGNGGNRYSDSCGSNVGGGGGAGGYVVDYVSVTPGGTATVTVGTNAGSRTSSFAGGTTITASGGTNGSNAVAYNSNCGVSGAASLFGVTYYSPSVARSYANGITVSDIYLAALNSNSLGNIAGVGQCYAHGYGVGGWFNNHSGISTGRQNPIGYGAGGGGGDSSGGPTTGTNGIVIVEW